MKLQRLEDDVSLRDRRIDVGIVTVIPTEVAAVFRVFGVNPEVPVNILRPLDYWEATLTSRLTESDLRIVVTFLSGAAGNTESGITTAFFLRDWNPRLMCLVGIAAGARDRAKIGDVVLANRIHDTCVTVRGENGHEVPRGDAFGRDITVSRMLKLRPVSGDHLTAEVRSELGAAFFEEARTLAKALSLTQSEFSGKLSVLDGSLLTSNRLLKDSGYLADFRKTTDETCRGAEMEAAGFARACDIEKMPWLIVRGISDFGDSRKDDSFQYLAAFAAASALRMVLGESIDMAELPHSSPTGHEAALGTNIVEELLDAHRKGHWDQTVLIGSFLSRPFWVSGRHELRARLGEVIDDAAAKANDVRARAAALIDDRGWTTFILGDPESAAKHIKDGLRLAKDARNPYLVAKAHRHLASIARRGGDLKTAGRELTAARRACATITDVPLREEMEAALVASKAQFLMAKGEHKVALAGLLEAKEKFARAHDRARELKLFVLLGEASEALGHYLEAETFYQQGYDRARSAGRKDATLANATQLGRLLLSQARYAEAAQWLTRAIQHAYALDDVVAARGLRDLLQAARQADGDERETGEPR